MHVSPGLLCLEVTGKRLLFPICRLPDPIVVALKRGVALLPLALWATERGLRLAESLS